MGYDLQITRKEFWADEEGPVITSAEWLGLIHDDPSLTLDEENGPYFAVWTGPGEYPDWIDYDEGGYLFSKNPTDEGVDKMIEVANRLDARVQGEDGEAYTINWRNE
jgi:hypothetical protein